MMFKYLLSLDDSYWSGIAMVMPHAIQMTAEHGECLDSTNCRSKVNVNDFQVFQLYDGYLM